MTTTWRGRPSSFLMTDSALFFRGRRGSMKIVRSPSARLLLWPLYLAIAAAGCGRVAARDVSEDDGSATSLPRQDAGQTSQAVGLDGAVLDGAAKTPTGQSDTSPKGTSAQADAASAPDPSPPSDNDAGMGGDPKGPGAVSTGGCTKKDDCGELVCSLPNGTCVECLVDHDCKDKAKCDPKTLTCVAMR